MFNNNLKIAVRNLVRNKNYSFLNIGGLTLGVIVTILLSLWIFDELSYNKNHDNYDFIAKVCRKNLTGMISQIVPTGFGSQLKAEYGNHFKHMALVRQRLEQRVILSENNKFTEGGYFVQADLPKMFTLNMIQGSQDGLEDLRTIIISESLSHKLFGTEEPINQTVKMGDDWELKVTGVYKDLPLNSEFSDAEFFAPLGIYLQGWSSLDVWDNYNMRLYVQVNQNTDFNQVSTTIKNSMLPHVDEAERKGNLELFLHPMSKWHLNSNFEYIKDEISNRKLLLGFIGLVGIFVLLLACINFINLNTASSEGRMKEIGIRKTLGSPKLNLVTQFLSESFLIVITSFFIALLCSTIIIDPFNQIISKDLALPWLNNWFWIASVLLIVITSLLAGGYPALYLSSFNPVDSLKRKNSSTKSSSFSRRLLVVFQFCTSIVLLICSFIVFDQIQFVKDRPVGFDRESLISLKPQIPSEKIELLRTELKKTGAIKEITVASNAITNTYGWLGQFDWIGKDPENTPSFNYVLTNHEYGKTMGLNFIEGRNFSRDLIDDYNCVIINRAAQEIIGFDNPIGEYISAPAIDSRRNKYKVIGLVSNMIKGSPYDEPIPTIIFLSNLDLTFTYIRINSEISSSKALPIIEASFTKLFPSLPFDYEFVNDIHNAKFKAEDKIGKLASISAVMALIISCLGLFGLSSYMIERKTKEIGIRKVVGASVPSILSLLAKNFTKSVLIANIIAWPLGYYIMYSWLNNFTFRTNISIWPFLISGIIALVVSVLTVLSKSYLAATANPVDSLRNE